jgi:mono/diheme cytochrome c family protein
MFTQRLATISLAMLFASPSAISKSDEESVKSGWELAVKECSHCHVVATPPIAHLKGAPDGPDFQNVANGSKASFETLRNFLHSTHSDVKNPGAMPHMDLNDEQIHQLSEYFKSLRQQR